jgi:hypothetical protein
LALEAAGGAVFENDAMLDRWAAEWDEADRLGLISCASAWSIDYALTPRAWRYLDELRGAGCPALTLLGRVQAGSTPAA